MSRPLLLALLGVFAVPATAAALASAPGEGSLSVRAGDGNVNLNLRGAVIGLVGTGRIEIEGPKDDDCDALHVWGAERQKIRVKKDEIGGHETVCVFAGKDVRIRLVGGHNHVRLSGHDISLSAVGRGIVGLKGKGGPNDGTYAVNGGDHQSLPDEGRRFLLADKPLALSALSE